MSTHRTDAATAATAILAAGVCAALHVGKLAPALAALQQALGLTLVEAGFLLSAVQGAGMALGVALGALADGIGARRSMLAGLLTLALTSAAGGSVDGVPMLMALRVLEGFGFLLVVLPAPGLLRRCVAPERRSAVFGLWGAYMPLATALALLLGPLVVAEAGWRAWWWGLALLTAAMSVWLWRVVPAQEAVALAAATPFATRLRRTLGARGPWLVAVCFGMYSGQWLAVIGFLPTIYAQAGVAPLANGLLTAAAAAANIVGNIASGRLLQRGAAPQALLVTGFVVMGLAAAAAFAAALPPASRYVAVLLFSGVGGLIPGTLFALAVRLAPGEDTLATTVGFVQQWSSFGQFAGPPLVAWVASRAGGWQFTGLAAGLCSLAGLVLVALLARRLRVDPRLGLRQDLSQALRPPA